MRLASIFFALFTLCSCSPPESLPSTHIEQSSLLTVPLVVPPGPVAVPTLAGASSALTAGQILCDSFRIDPEDEDQGYTIDTATQCVETTNSIYKEIQVQLVSLTSPSTLDHGLASMDENTTFLFPDGSYTQGSTAFKASLPSLFGASPVTAVQNKFIYKPLNKDTVVVIGDPSYTLGSGATVDSVQFRVYTRRHGGEGSCRSLSNLSGRTCWAEAAGQWTYKRPFTGSSYPHAISSARAQIPTAASYPLTLEPQRIVCDGSFRQLGGRALGCEQVVREFYKEIQFQVLTLTNPNTASSGLAALNEATTFVYPTGLVTEGLSALLANLGNLFGANRAPVGIENKFLYKAIDSDTVLFIGGPQFSLLDFVTNQTSTIESVQVSVYRRNSTALGNCRSAVNLNGDVCWTELAEQWVYGQPLLGN